MNRYIRPQPLPEPEDRRHSTSQATLAALMVVAGWVLIARTPFGVADWMTFAGFVLVIAGGVWGAALWSRK